VDDGSSYSGEVDITESGKTCMYWAVATKHSKASDPNSFPDINLQEMRYLGDSCSEDDECVSNSVCDETERVCVCDGDHVSTPASNTKCYTATASLGGACFFNSQCVVGDSSCTGGSTCQCNAGFTEDNSPVSSDKPRGRPNTCYKQSYLQDSCEFDIQCSSQVEGSVCEKVCVCGPGHVSIPASNKTCYTDTNCKSTKTGCGLYSGCEGVISSDNYPNNYNSYTNCTYTIEGKQGQKITLKSAAFKTESAYDVLTISYGGETQKFSGDASVDINTDTDRVVLQFTSDKGH